jgi:hypothetical protein
MAFEADKKAMLTRIVSNSDELKFEIQNVKPGTEILIEPGIYTIGFAGNNIQGTMTEPVIIAGKEPDDPPMFIGRGEGVKFSNIAYLKLANLHIVGFNGNGINIDDGGKIGAPSHHVILENISIKDIGRKGNHDAIKMSGVDNFVLKECHIEGWGGSGIDLVGCHNGIIETSQFHGVNGYRTKNAIQIKGGSSEIIIQCSAFINAGERIINIGGSTGGGYFRPRGVDYEAKNVIVAGNRFVGGEAHLAWVTSQQTHVHHNIFYLPGKFLGRILQETKDSRFQPSKEGLFDLNLIVTDQRVRTFINVGRGTSPKSFSFQRNAWYRLDSKSKPKLPTREIEGIYNVYPDLKAFGTPQMKIDSKNPILKDIGPRAYKPWPLQMEFADVQIPSLKLATLSGSTRKFFPW